jgi:ABC-type transporter Mla MlaB component
MSFGAARRPSCIEVSSPTDIHVLIRGQIVHRVDASRVDVALIDELARMQVAACRAGARVRLDNVPEALYELAEFLGLADAIGLDARG